MSASPNIVGCVKIERRLGEGYAYPCSYLLNSVTTYVCENGTYTVTYEATLEWILNGEGECSDPTITSTAEEGFDYGAVISATVSDEEYASDTDAITQAEGAVEYPHDEDGNPIWDAFAVTAPVGKEQIRDALTDNLNTIAEATCTVLDADAAVHVAQIRLTLIFPLVCRVVVQHGTKDPDPPYPDPPSDWVWGDETGIVLTPGSPTYTLDVDHGDPDVVQAYRLVRYEFIPYT